MSPPMMAQQGPFARRLALQRDAAELWSADLRAIPEAWSACLSTGELRRAGLLLDRRSARRFRGGRALLRMLLAAYTGTDPASLEILAGAHGKPMLRAPGGPAFNVSHTGPIILLAFAGQRSVGVDVQLPRTGIDEPALAARALGGACSKRLGALAPDARPMAFLRAWTAHEAALKWQGTGIGAPLGRSPWTAHLELGRASAGLALEGPPRSLSLRTLSGPPLRLGPSGV